MFREEYILLSNKKNSEDKKIQFLTLSNRKGMSVSLINLGATLISVKLPITKNDTREVLLGCATVQQYLEQKSFMGASIGRYANRIAHSTYNFQNESIVLLPNQQLHQLHGGPQGFHQRYWNILYQSKNQVKFGIKSLSGDQGFPGNLNAHAHFLLDDSNKITVLYTAKVDKACPVNLTNHAYFNLDKSHRDVRHHTLQISANYYLPVNESGIPYKGLKTVNNTSFDFRIPKMICSDFLKDDDQRKVKGYDHAFLLLAAGNIEKPAASLWSRDKRLKMIVYTNTPSLQFYCGNYLKGTPSRSSAPYKDWYGLALESGFLPDSPNHPEWPQNSCFLLPGQKYISQTSYQFFTYP